MRAVPTWYVVKTGTFLTIIEGFECFHYFSFETRFLKNGKPFLEKMNYCVLVEIGTIEKQYLFKKLPY